MMTPQNKKKLIQGAATLIGAAVMAIYGLFNPFDAKNYTGKVSKISDGDTVHVVDYRGTVHKIRMAFIDAPESKQAGGKASQASLEKMVTGQEVQVEVIDTDQYQREVARLRVNNQDVNLAQIQNGHAWHYQSIAKRNQPKEDFARYEAAQAEAQKKRRGLWRQSDAVAPWVYRKERRNGNNTQ